MSVFHDFTLILTQVHEMTDEYIDAIFQARCDDGTIWLVDGVLGIDFTREAPTREEAIGSVMDNLTPINLGVRPTLQERP